MTASMRPTPRTPIQNAAPPVRSGLAGLSPAYFGMVMATGIVSIAAYLLGLPWVAHGLFALNAAL
jgi:tellurite resistance protein TehA-like permease